MSDAAPTPVPRATYQGIPCRSWKAARTPGFESDSYEVEMATAGLASLKFQVPGALGLYAAAQDAGPTSSGTTATGNDSGAPAVGSQLYTRGDLVIADGAHEIKIRALYVRDDGIEVVDTGDDENGPGIVRVALVDIRYFWGRRGDLWGRYNIPIPGSNGEYEPESLDGGEAVADGESGGRGVPLTLERALQKIAARLPGRPPISGMPAEVKEKIPTGLVWEGATPRDELERLCALYGLTCTLTLDNKLKFTDASEARPDDGRSGAGRTIGGATLSEGCWRRTRRIAYRYRPECVRVVGPRVVREVRVDKWEPVGYPRDPETKRADLSKLVSWELAAQSYGLTLFDLSSVVLISEDQQAQWFRSKGLDVAACKEVAVWAFRLFRIPVKQKGFLPILSHRATKFVKTPDTSAVGTDEETDALGTGGPDLTRPLVEVDTFLQERRRLSELDTGSGTQETTQTTTIGDADGDAFATAEEVNLVPVVNADGDVEAVPTAEPILNAKGGLASTGPASVTEVFDPPESDGLPTDSGGNFTVATLKALQRDSHDPIVTFARNVARQRVFGGYEIDEKAGLIRFDSPVGHRARTGTFIARVGHDDVPELDAILLEPAPRVRVTFAYEDSAAARAALRALGSDPQNTGGAVVGDGIDQLPPPETGQMESMYHYHALYDRAGDEQGNKPNEKTGPGLRDSLAARGDGALDNFRFPLVVRDDSMQLAVTIDRRSNRAELDKRAKDIATAIMAPKQAINGEDGEAHGVYPILPSSVISTVQWEGGPDGTCRTRWTIDNALAAKALLTGAKIARVVAARPEGGASQGFVERLSR